VQDPRECRILVTDGDDESLRMVGRVLQASGYEWAPARDPVDALDRLAESDFSLVLSEMSTPDDAGWRLVEHVRAEHPQTATIVITAEDSPELASAALKLGVYGYILKPFTPNQLTIAVDNALRRRELEIENAAHREALEQIVLARTTALERSAKQLKLTREETIRRLSRAVEYRDEETGGHTERMSRYCAILARRAGLDAESIRVASPMHDVGKVAVPDEILLKPGRLTPEERIQMELHTVIGHEILSGSGSALLELAATIAWTHHEKFDGSGYPRRLSGSAIPLEGRTAAIADVFDALTSDRSYRPAFNVEAALEMMREERGRHFDPSLLDLFFDAIDDIVAIRTRFSDEAVDRPAVRSA
jgi:putative two-component system response regulator